MLNIKPIPDKEEQYTLYVKRTKGSIYGVVTLQRVIDGQATKLFDKLPMASGQLGYLAGGKQDWVPSKSPTPIGEFWLSTKKEPLTLEPVGTPFYCISTNKGDNRLFGPDGVVRTAAGLHLENRTPGTIGCVALLHDTNQREQMAYLLFKELDRLYKAGIKHIKVKVFF